MIEIRLHGVQVAIAPQPDGSKVLTFADPLGIVVVVPLPDTVARAVAEQLAGGVVIASRLPQQ